MLTQTRNRAQTGKRHPDSLKPFLGLRPKALWAGAKNENLAFWFLCLAVFFEYIRPQDMYPILNIGPLGQITLLLCVAGVVISGAMPLRFGPVDGLFITFSLLLLASAITAWNPGVSWDFRDVFLSWILVYFCITSLITTPRRALLFFLVFFLINFKMSEFGTRTFVMRGFSFAGWGVAGAPGWFSNSGELAMEMTVVFGMSAALLAAHRQFVGRWAWRLLAILLPGTALVTIIGSSSRGGQLALLVVGSVLLVRLGFRARNLLVIIAGFVIGFLLLPEEQKVRFSEMGEDKTSILRLEYWGDAVEIAKEHPVTGIGYMNWGPYYRRYYDLRGEEVHNTVLQAFAEMGFPGVLAFLGLFVTALVTNERTSRRFSKLGEGGQSMAGMALGLNLSLIGIFVSSLFMSVLYYPVFWVAFALTAALRNQAVIQKKPVKKRVPSPRAARGPVAAFSSVSGSRLQGMGVRRD